LNKEQANMEDGRYIIFYTFDDPEFEDTKEEEEK
jgi:hypothetical protein